MKKVISPKPGNQNRLYLYEMSCHTTYSIGGGVNSQWYCRQNVYCNGSLFSSTAFGHSWAIPTWC